MQDEDFNKISDGFVKALEPVYSQLDRIEQTLNEHTDKIDALTGDVIQLQNDVGGIYDKISSINDNLTNHITEDQKEHDVIRKHVDLPPVIRESNP